jgi:hypothetical protein
MVMMTGDVGEDGAMSSLLDAEQQMSCVAIPIGVHTVLDVVQLGGAIFIPVAAIWTIMAVARRNPTNARRWTGRRVDGLLGGGAAKHVAAVILPAGVILFGVGLAVPIQRPDSSCAESLGLLSVTRLLVILVGGVLLGAAWAYTLQPGTVQGRARYVVRT